MFSYFIIQTLRMYNKIIFYDDTNISFSWRLRLKYRYRFSDVSLFNSGVSYWIVSLPYKFLNTPKHYDDWRYDYIQKVRSTEIQIFCTWFSARLSKRTIWYVCSSSQIIIILLTGKKLLKPIYHIDHNSAFLYGVNKSIYIVKNSNQDVEMLNLIL